MKTIFYFLLCIGSSNLYAQVNFDQTIYDFPNIRHRLDAISSIGVAKIETNTSIKNALVFKNDISFSYYVKEKWILTVGGERMSIQFNNGNVFERRQFFGVAAGLGHITKLTDKTDISFSGFINYVKNTSIVTETVDGDATNRGDFGDNVLFNVNVHLEYSISRNILFKIGFNQGYGLYGESSSEELAIDINDTYIAFTGAAWKF